MSDGWQGRVFRRHSVVDDEGRRLTRVTRVRRHYALQRALVKYCDAPGNVQSSMIFAEPRPLQHGARSGNFFNALIDFSESPRFYTKGPLVEVFCFDGELFTALGKLISGRKAMMYDMADDVLIDRLATRADPFVDVPLLKASYFLLFIKCTSHSMSNATKWGLSRWGTIDTIDDLYIAISACISCSTDLFDVLPAFAEHAGSRDAESKEEWAARHMLWNLLVSDAAMVDKIMLVNPRWDSAAGKLYVSCWVDTDPHGKDALLAVLRHFCSWVKFTITRWATVAKAAQMWVGSLLAGLDGWVALCQADPDVNNSLLNGHDKGKNVEVRTDGVVACFCGMVVEGTGMFLSPAKKFGGGGSKGEDFAFKPSLRNPRLCGLLVSPNWMLVGLGDGRCRASVVESDGDA